MTYAALERALTELGFVKSQITEPAATFFEYPGDRATLILPTGQTNEQVDPLDLITARRTVYETGIATLEEYAVVVDRAIRGVTARRVIRRKAVRLKTPSLADFGVYLESNGWYRVSSENPNALIYHGPKDIYGKPISVVLPADADVSDAKPRLDDVVRTLSAIAAKSPASVTREIAAFGKRQSPRTTLIQRAR